MLRHAIELRATSGPFLVSRIGEPGRIGLEAARFLSVADERNPEANVFRYAGRLEKFRRVRIPVLAVFGSEEEFAAIPPAKMLEILAAKTASARFLGWEVAGAGHGFHGFEDDVAEGAFRWMATLPRGGRGKAAAK